MVLVSAVTSASAGAPCLTWAASSCEPAKENVTFVPGCSFSYAAPAVLKTSVSEEAASTVRFGLGRGGARAVAWCRRRLSSLSSLPQAASGHEEGGGQRRRRRYGGGWDRADDMRVDSSADAVGGAARAGAA